LPVEAAYWIKGTDRALIIIIIQYTADLLSNQAFALKIREQQSKCGDSTMVMKKVIPWSEVV